MFTAASYTPSLALVRTNCYESATYRAPASGAVSRRIEGTYHPSECTVARTGPTVVLTTRLSKKTRRRARTVAFFGEKPIE